MSDEVIELSSEDEEAIKLEVEQKKTKLKVLRKDEK